MIAGDIVSEMSREISDFFKYTENNKRQTIEIKSITSGLKETVEVYKRCVCCNITRCDVSDLFRLGVGAQFRFCEDHYKKFLSLAAKYEALSPEQGELFKRIWNIYRSVEHKSKL